MSSLFADLPVTIVIFALCLALLAGFVKGAVGFAMPMILVSGLGSILPAEITIGILILPTLATNMRQAFRNGLSAAFQSFLKHWRYNAILFVVLIFSAQLLTRLPSGVLFVILGLPIAGFAVLQLAGWSPQFRRGTERLFEALIATIAGFFGGMTGVWGPPTVMYLTALDTPKAESVRVQGVVYFLGAVFLLLAHMQSGVMNATIAPLSALVIIPALLGQSIGIWLQDRMPQAVFRRATLAVLVIAGLNLIRRGLVG